MIRPPHKLNLQKHSPRLVPRLKNIRQLFYRHSFSFLVVVVVVVIILLLLLRLLLLKKKVYRFAHAPVRAYPYALLRQVSLVDVKIRVR
jgi:uncharacterized protein YqhQ